MLAKCFVDSGRAMAWLQTYSAGWNAEKLLAIVSTNEASIEPRIDSRRRDGLGGNHGDGAGEESD